MGFFDDIGYFFDGIRGIVEGAAEDLSDIAECATTGFVEMVIKGNEDYQTSYDKKAEADEIYALADQRLQKTSEALNKKIDKLNSVIKCLNERKLKQLNGMCKILKTVDFKTSGSISTPSYSESYPFDNYLQNFDIISSVIRNAHASEYLEDAKDFRSECNFRCSQMNEMSVRIDALFELLSEEERLLDIIEHSLYVKRDELNTKIANKLHTLLKEHICSMDGSLNDGYALTVSELKGLCSLI